MEYTIKTVSQPRHHQEPLMTLTHATQELDCCAPGTPGPGKGTSSHICTSHTASYRSLSLVTLSCRTYTLPCEMYAPACVNTSRNRSCLDENQAGALDRQMTPRSMWKPASPVSHTEALHTYLNNSRILRECMLSFWRFTYSNIFDITSPENDVLIDFLSWGSRPICGTVFSTKGPHLGVRKRGVKLLSCAKSMRLSFGH